MLFNSFSSLIQALSLTQGLFKPIPQLLDATKTLAAPLLNVVHDVSSPLLGITHDLTTPLVGAVKDIEGPILGAVKDVTAPLLGAVHDITQPILEPVKGIFDPVLDVVKDSSSLLGLPLSGLSLLNLLQNEASTNDQPSSQGPNTMQDTLDAAHAAAAASQVGALATQDTDNAPPVHNLAKLNVAQTQHDDSSCAVAPYDVNVEDVTFTPFDSVKSNIFRYRQQQSVNLGSWFVHEDWMTPSLYTCAAGKRSSELDIAQGWGSVDKARAVLEHHWDTWITQKDFEYLASIGINTVRLPIGYWSLGPDFMAGTDFAQVASAYTGSWRRVRRAISWAAENGIGVLVDLHGAPGSQNGQSHSGVSTGRNGLFTSEENLSKTINVLAYLAQQFSSVTNVVGIQILNEPDNVPNLPAFYDRAISAIRGASANSRYLPLYIHDGFDLDRFSNYVAGRSDFVVEDHHSYFVFTPHDAAQSVRLHTVDIKTNTDRSLARASGRERRNLIVGEWSCALTEDSLRGDSDPEAARAAFCTGQEEVYRNETAGWHFWSYKMEHSDAGWSFRDAVGNSLPSTFFSYSQGAPTSSQTFLSAMDANPSKAYESSRKRDHRFSAIHQRRQLGSDVQNTRGYSDGFATAKIFATHSLSKLGFIDQYIDDSIEVLGVATVPAGTAEVYRSGFMQGLREAEGLIRTSIA